LVLGVLGVFVVAPGLWFVVGVLGVFVVPPAAAVAMAMMATMPPSPSSAQRSLWDFFFGVTGPGGAGAAEGCCGSFWVGAVVSAVDLSRVVVVSRRWPSGRFEVGWLPMPGTLLEFYSVCIATV
jgi:hypothetical protein